MDASGQIDITTVLLPMICVIFIIATGVVLLNSLFQKRLYRQKILQEELINQHQEELLKSSIQIQEEERKRIANDLHDELGAVLSITRMHLFALEEKCKTNRVEFQADLENIRSLTETSISSIRRISHELMPQNLQMFGLIKTLQNLITTLNNNHELSVQLSCTEELTELPWIINLGLYRISLELMNNTIKHAQATQVTINIFSKNGMLTFDYEDNGKGIIQKKGEAGLGQRSIEARAISMGGTLNISNTPGFHALIEIPYPASK